MVEPGRRCLGNRYELQQLIAAGGMGQVWRGFDVLLGRPVAVKVLRSEYTGDPTFLARFRGEAQHAASLSHPNIAAVFDYGEVIAEDGSGETLAYLVMELVEGEPLSAVLRRDAPLDIAASLSVLRQTADALATAHRVGMVHRDVKPGNILVGADDGVKITDFGIAWSAGSVPLTRTGQVIGTAQYLSPEQAEGKHATPASDVYALGLVGYECLTGRPAFDGDNPVTIALKQVRQDPEPLPEQLPPGVRTLIMRALAKDPEVRYPDGAAFAAAIEDAAAGRSTAAVELPAAAVPPPPQRPAADPPTRVGATRTGASGVTSPTGSSHISPPVRRRRRTLTSILVPVIALLAGAVIAVVVLQSMSREGTSMPAPAAATNKVDTGGIVLNAGDYVGRPIGAVADELAHRGLAVQRQAVLVPGAVPGLVTGVSPTGTALSLGDSVVVSYAAGRSGGATSRVENAPAPVAGLADTQPTGTSAAPTGTTGDSDSSAATRTSAAPSSTGMAGGASATDTRTSSAMPSTGSSSSSSSSATTTTSTTTSSSPSDR